MRTLLIVLTLASLATSARADCRYEGADVVCPRLEFAALMDEADELETRLAVALIELDAEREGRAADVQLEREIADTLVRGAALEARYWQTMAKLNQPSWWDRHRALVAWGLGVSGTGAVAAGVGMAIADGDPAVAAGLVVGGAVGTLVGGWVGWP